MPPRPANRQNRDPSGIDPAHHALLLGQSHRNCAEIERLQRLYDERGEQLRELTKELKGECDARAEAEDKARAAEATTLRLMSLNKNLLDSYQKLLDEKANDAVGQGGGGGGGWGRSRQHVRRRRGRARGRGNVAGVQPTEGRDARALARRRRWRRSRRVRRVRRCWPRIPAAEVEPERTEGHAAATAAAAVAAALRDAADDDREGAGCRRGADGGADDATARGASTSSLMPSVYHPSSSRTAQYPRRRRLRGRAGDEAEFAEAEAAANRAAAWTRPWPRCWTACETRWRRGRGVRVASGVAERRVRERESSRRVAAEQSHRDAGYAEREGAGVGGGAAAWLMERMEEKGAQIAALTRTLERSKEDAGDGGDVEPRGLRDSAASRTLTRSLRTTFNHSRLRSLSITATSSWVSTRLLQCVFTIRSTHFTRGLSDVARLSSNGTSRPSRTSVSCA